MPALAVTLVLLSAFSHAAWNLLLKRSDNQQIFVWALLAIGAVLLLPLGIALFWLYPPSATGLVLVATSSITHVFYFSLLGRAYSRGDLSLVYPIARGIGPTLVPLIAVIWFEEEIGPSNALGIALIVIGIFLVSWWGRFQSLLANPSTLVQDPGIRYAVLTGITITIYTLVDKQGVGHVQPFLYMYLLTLGSAIGFAPYIFHTYKLATVQREMNAHRRPMLAASFLVFLAYGLVLTALSISQVSYVAPAREIGIVVGVLMGVFFLKEQFGQGRLLGSAFIVAGLVLIALPPWSIL